MVTCHEVTEQDQQARARGRAVVAVVAAVVGPVEEAVAAVVWAVRWPQGLVGSVFARSAATRYRTG